MNEVDDIPDKPVLPFLYCSECKTVRHVASGYVAEAMTLGKLRNIAAQIGWQLEPVVLCPDCVKPDVVP